MLTIILEGAYNACVGKMSIVKGEANIFVFKQMTLTVVLE